MNFDEVKRQAEEFESRRQEYYNRSYNLSRNGDYKNGNGKPTPSDFLLFQQKRMSTFLFKMFLVELEGMLKEGLISEEYFNKLRKSILDRANAGFREFEEYLSKFDIRFKR